MDSDEPDPAWILRPDILRGLKQVAKHEYSYDLLAKPPNWQYISMVAEAVPDLPMVIDHIAKPNIRVRQYKEWYETMALAARFPQIMLKLSGMINENEADCEKIFYENAQKFYRISEIPKS